MVKGEGGLMVIRSLHWFILMFIHLNKSCSSKGQASEGLNSFNRGFLGETGKSRCFQSDLRARGSAITKGFIKSGTMCSTTTLGGRELRSPARSRKNLSFSAFVFRVRLLRKSLIKVHRLLSIGGVKN